MILVFFIAGLLAVSAQSFQDQFVEQSQASIDDVFDQGQVNNAYLPPLGGAPSEPVSSFERFPLPAEQPEVVEIEEVAPVFIQNGCSAAMLCVEDRFCDKKGVITKEPHNYTPEQLLRGVPKVACRNPENGIVGKCCRDPDYVDPWPAGNLPADYSGGFNPQGFPNNLFPKNISSVTTKRPRTTTLKPIVIPVTNRPVTFAAEKPRTTTLKPIVVPVTNRPVTFAAEKPRPTTLKPIVIPTTNRPVTFATRRPSNFVQPTAKRPVTTKKPIVTVKPKLKPYEIPFHVVGAQCGLRNVPKYRDEKLSPEDVHFGEIPWQAMILSNSEKKLLCGGVLVAPNAIVTTATCIEGRVASDVSIKVGEWKLGYELKWEEPLPFEIVQVSQIVPHYNWYPNSPSYDIAVLLLEKEVKYNLHVDSVCLAQGPLPVANKNCFATGWGKVVLQVHNEGALMHGIDIDLLSQSECNNRLQNAETQLQIDNTMVCGKAKHQWNNVCQVDFGGPLVCDRGDGFYELVGVYSRETGCMPTNQVATFTIIDNEWVRAIIEGRQYPPVIVEVPTTTEEPECPCVQKKRLQLEELERQRKELEQKLLASKQKFGLF